MTAKPKVKAPAGKTDLKWLPFDSIQPVENVRVKCDAQKLKELEDSIQRNGILQPLIVCEGGGILYPLVAGYRRYAVAEKLGLGLIPVLIRPEMTEDQILDIQLEENLRREDLNPIDEGKALMNYQKETGGTIEELAERIGKSPRYIARRISLVQRLLPEFKKLVEDGSLQLNRAYVIAALSRKDQRELSWKRPGLEEWQKREAKETMTTSTVHEFLEYMDEELHQVAGAPWSKDPKEVKQCDDCMERSDRQGYLLPTKGTKLGRCLNSECWEKKRNKFMLATLEKIKAKGGRILNKSEVGLVVNYLGKSELKAGKLAYFGMKSSPNIPTLAEELFKKKCKTCPELGYFIYVGTGYQKGRASICTACCNPACYMNQKKKKGATVKSDSPEAISHYNEEVKRAGILFATAAWAMVRAEKESSDNPGDLSACIALIRLFVHNESYCRANSRQAMEWILDCYGCYRDDESYESIKPYADLMKIATVNISRAARAITMFRFAAGDIFEVHADQKELLYHPGEKMVAAIRKRFSPGSPFYLKAMVKGGIVTVGRFYNVPKIGGKRDDAIKKIAAAGITSKDKMPEPLEALFIPKAWKKLSK